MLPLAQHFLDYILFLTPELAEKAEITFFSARDTTGPGFQPRESWIIIINYYPAKYKSRRISRYPARLSRIIVLLFNILMTKQNVLRLLENKKWRSYHFSPRKHKITYFAGYTIEYARRILSEL